MQEGGGQAARGAGEVWGADGQRQDFLVPGHIGGQSANWLTVKMKRSPPAMGG